MKQREISAVIDKRLKKIEVLFHEIISRFEMESIHEFRTEIKKLRAFIRLLNIEIDSDKMQIPKGVKTFYGYAGTIRNLQLQLKNMHTFTGNPRYPLTESYIEYLEQMIEKWKANAVEFTGPGNHFLNDQKKILQQLPGKLRWASVKKFLQKKINELAILVKELPDDEVLHRIRKLLKDILYNWIIIKYYRKLLPPVFSREQKIKSFTELLGLFLDKGMVIILLETYCRDCEENGLFSEKEVKELQGIERRWKSEKRELGQILYLNPVLNPHLLTGSGPLL